MKLQKHEIKENLIFTLLQFIIILVLPIFLSFALRPFFPTVWAGNVCNYLLGDAPLLCILLACFHVAIVERPQALAIGALWMNLLAVILFPVAAIFTSFCLRPQDPVQYHLETGLTISTFPLHVVLITLAIEGLAVLFKGISFYRKSRKQAAPKPE